MHLVSLVRMDLVFCFGVEKKAGNLVGCFAKSVIFVFHISKNLIKVARMQCMSAVMLLCGMGIIFCVNDQYAAAKLSLCMTGSMVPLPSSSAQGIWDAVTDSWGKCFL